MKELIRKLTAVSSPSGREEPVRAVIKEEIARYVDEIYEDKLGNLIAAKHGGNTKVLLAAHMDEVGMIVTDIDEEGFLRFSHVGGLNPQRLVAQRARFANGTTGVFGAEKLEEKEKLTLSKLYLDIGTVPRKKRGRKSRSGDPADATSVTSATGLWESP